MSPALAGLIDSPFQAISSYLIRRTYVGYERSERPLIASINVVNTCNLYCAGCYWGRTERREHRNDLSVAAGQELIRTLWTQGVRQFLFLGGEPMRARTRVEAWVHEVAQLGGYSTIITNGTYGLPAVHEWPRTHYFVSCDGDEVGTNMVRGIDRELGRPVFDIIREVATGRQDVIVAMTISLLNVERIVAFIREVCQWDIGGAVFSFATPYVGDRQSFYLSDEMKEDVVDQLLSLKNEYGDFIVMSRRAIDLLRPKQVAKWSHNCPTWAARSLRADGKPIERCIFGPDADCSRCGCNISTSMVALREGDSETARMVGMPMRLASAAKRGSSLSSWSPTGDDLSAG